jgi:hypothetical protein
MKKNIGSGMGSGKSKLARWNSTTMFANAINPKKVPPSTAPGRGAGPTPKPVPKKNARKK